MFPNSSFGSIICLVSILVNGTLMVPCTASEPAESTSSELEQLSSQLASSVGATGIECRAVLKVRSHVGDKVFVAPGLTPEQQVSLHYVAVNDLFYYKLVAKWWNDKPADDVEVAYNGGAHQMYDGDARRLEVGHAAFGEHGVFDHFNAPFLPFDFLAVADGERRVIHLPLLRQNHTWAKAIASARPFNSEPVDAGFLALDLPGGICELGVHDAMTYRVYFRKEDGYPMRWKLLSKAGDTLQEYIVDELVDAGGFRYPKRARLLEYGSHMKKPDAQPRATVDVTIESVRVNGRTPDDEIFTIDPSKAKIIYDRDSGTGISVP